MSKQFIIRTWEEQFGAHEARKIEKRINDYIFVHVSLSNHHGAALMMPDYLKNYTLFTKGQKLVPIKGNDLFERECREGIDRICKVFEPIFKKKIQEGEPLFSLFGVEKTSCKKGYMSMKIFIDKLGELLMEDREAYEKNGEEEFLGEMKTTIEKAVMNSTVSRKYSSKVNFYQWAYTICPLYFEHTYLFSWGTIEDGCLGLGDKTSEWVIVTNERGAGKFEGESFVHNMSVSIDQKKNKNFRFSVTPNGNLSKASGLAAMEGTKKPKAMGFIQVEQFQEIYQKPLVFTKVSCGGNYTMAVASNGVLFCWGYEGQGCLGGAKSFNKKNVNEGEAFKEKKGDPAPHSLSNLMSNNSRMTINLTAQRPSYLDLSTKRQMINEHPENEEEKELGVPKFLDYRWFGGFGVQDVSAGFQHVLAINRKGQLYSWGNGQQGSLGHKDFLPKQSPTLVTHPDVQNVVYISAGQDYSAAINSDNQLFTWGGGSFYRLGTGSDSTLNEPTMVDAFEVQRIYSVTCGSTCTFAINSDGKLYGWGSGIYGKLGIDHVDFNKVYPTPREVGKFNEVFYTSQIKQVKSSLNHTVAITSTQDLYTWGRHNRGVLGLGRRQNNETIPVKVPGFKMFCPVNFSVNEIPETILKVWPLETTKNTLVDPKEPEEYQKQIIVGVYCTKNHTFFKSNFGRLYVAGPSDLFQTESKKKVQKSRQTFGNERAPTLDRWVGSIVYIPAPVNVVAVGTDHCVILAEKFQVYVWGSNKKLQLGLGSNVESVRKPFFLKEMSKRKIVLAAASPASSFFISCLGEVYGCGTSDGGSLGLDKTKKNYLVDEPKIMRGVPPFKYISCGEKHCLALCLNDPCDVWAWGMGSFGRLGVGPDLRDRQTPFSIRDKMAKVPSAAKFKIVACGSLHSLVLDMEGNLYGAGVNKFAGFEFRDGLELEFTDAFTKLPEQMEMVWAAEFHNAGITKGKNDLYFWGEDRFQFEDSIGRYSRGTLFPIEAFNPQESERKIVENQRRGKKEKETRSVQVGVGPHHFAIVKAGACFSWGAYFNGRLGIGLWRKSNGEECTFLRIPTQAYIDFVEGTIKLKAWIAKKLKVEGKATVPENFLPFVEEKEDAVSSAEDEKPDKKKQRNFGFGRRESENALKGAEEEDLEVLELLKHRNEDIDEKKEEKKRLEEFEKKFCELQEAYEAFKKKEIELESLQFVDGEMRLALEDLFATTLREKEKLQREFQQLKYLNEAILLHQTSNIEANGPLALRETDSLMLYPEFISRNIQIYQTFLGLLLVHPCYLFKLIRHNKLINAHKLLHLILRIFNTSNPTTNSKLNFLLIKLCYMLFKSKFKKADALQYRQLENADYIILYQQIMLQNKEMKELLSLIFLKMMVSFLKHIPEKEKCFELAKRGEMKKVTNQDLQEKRNLGVRNKIKNTSRLSEKNDVSEFGVSYAEIHADLKRSDSINEDKEKGKRNQDDDEWWSSIFPSVLTNKGEFFDLALKQRSLQRFKEQKHLLKMVVADVFLFFEELFSDLAVECSIPARIAKMNTKFVSKIKHFANLLGFSPLSHKISERFVLMSTFSSILSLLQQINSFDKLKSLVGEAGERLLENFDEEMKRITGDLDWIKKGKEHVDLLFFQEKSLMQLIINFFYRIMEDEKKTLDFTFEFDEGDLNQDRMAAEMSRILAEAKKQDKKPKDEEKLIAMVITVKRLIFRKLAEQRMSQNNNFQLWKAIFSYEFSDQKDWFRVKVADLLELRKLYTDMVAISRKTGVNLFPHNNDYLKCIVELFEEDQLKEADVSTSILIKKLNIEVNNKVILTSLQKDWKVYRCAHCKGIYPKKFCRQRLLNTVEEIRMKGWKCSQSHQNEQSATTCAGNSKDLGRCNEKIPKRIYEALSPFELTPIHIIQQKVFVFKNNIRASNLNSGLNLKEIDNLNAVMDDKMAQDYLEVLSIIPPMPEKANRLLYLDELLQKIYQKSTLFTLPPGGEEKIKKFINNFIPQLNINAKLSKEAESAFEMLLESNASEFSGRYQKLILQFEHKIMNYFNKVIRHENRNETKTFMTELKNEIAAGYALVNANINDMRISVLKMMNQIGYNIVVSSKTLMTMNQKAAFGNSVARERLNEICRKKICVVYIFRELMKAKVLHRFLFDKGGKLPSV